MTLKWGQFSVTPYHDHSSTLSSNKQDMFPLLYVPWRHCTRTMIGRRDFAVAGPATWNSLPVDLRTSSLSRDTFAKKLKTHLFGCERS